MALVLAGCASSSNLLSDVVSGVVAERGSSGADSTVGAQLNPAYRYLRVDVAGRPPALLVLGYLDPHVDGDIEVWYSAKREVIKTQNGRIVATFGLETDWRAVRLLPPPPNWSEEPTNGVAYQRLRDEMPGYRYSLTDQVEVQHWTGDLPQGVPTALTQSVNARLRWYREVSLGSTGRTLQPAWYAWGQHGGRNTVVYSEQCLAPDFCLKLLRWPVQDGAG